MQSSWLQEAASPHKIGLGMLAALGVVHRQKKAAETVKQLPREQRGGGAKKTRSEGTGCVEGSRKRKGGGSKRGGREKA